MKQDTGIGFEFLPDHVAFNRMLMGNLPPDEAVIHDRPGYTPVAIDPMDTGRIYWADLGTRAFREWQHLYTVKQAVAEGSVDAFCTDMEILLRDDLIEDSLPVRGLIFHVSRCGSTLLGKCLDASPENLIINQGGPLQRGFWAWAISDFQVPLRVEKTHLIMFPRLVAAMTCSRSLDHKAAFIKFISWNIRYLDFVRSAFPDTPSLFMYRDPVEVIASVRRGTTAVLLAKGSEQAAFLTDRPAYRTAGITDISYLCHCYAGSKGRFLTSSRLHPHGV